MAGPLKDGTVREPVADLFLVTDQSRLFIYSGVCHEFLKLDRIVRKASDALTDACGFLSSHSHTPQFDD